MRAKAQRPGLWQQATRSVTCEHLTCSLGKDTHFSGAFVQHIQFTSGEASLQLRIDNWKPKLEPKRRCEATSFKIGSIVCTAVFNSQSSVAG
jgi:hypothetical protein